MVRILVVDDDAALCRTIRLICVTDGFEVFLAYNGVEALYLTEKHRPHVIVLDLEMPVMDGRSFSRELRTRGFTTPILVLSGRGARAGAREIGASAWLDKPFDGDELCRVLHELSPTSSSCSSK